MLWGCIKFIVAFAMFFVVGVGIVLGGIVLLGKCVGPPPPDQQLMSMMVGGNPIRINGQGAPTPRAIRS